MPRVLAATHQSARNYCIIVPKLGGILRFIGLKFFNLYNFAGACEHLAGPQPFLTMNGYTVNFVDRAQPLQL